MYALLIFFWNLGLATEGAKACRDYSFQILGCKRLIAIVDPEHIASRRVAEKMGMILEQEAMWRDEKVCIYSIIELQNK